MNIRVSITAEPIRATGFVSTDGTHQVDLGNASYLHINPETARQWVAVLERIAKAGVSGAD